MQDVFSEFDVDAILKLRVNLDMEDRPAWHFDKKRTLLSKISL